MSQAEAEKDDFQFVCNDCKRRDEDAKKPKIPSLKFKIGSSTSPPSNRESAAGSKPDGNAPNLISTSEQEETSTKKRKSSDLQAVPGMPPMKKWKQASISKAPSATLRGNGASHANPMHQAFMNGPTLAPQGQLDSTNGSNGMYAAPPGLSSPKRPVTQINGNYASSSKFGGPVASPQFPNGQPSTGPKVVNGNHSASSPPNGHNVTQTAPQNLFHSSFEQQTPKAQAPSSNFTTPLNNSTSKSPLQSPYLNTPSTNLPPSSAAAPILQPGFSPQKPMQSSPVNPVASSPSLQGKTSPRMAPPPGNMHMHELGGLSPSKHSPPRPASNHSLGESISFPPVQSRAPASQQHE